jgi:hypothetical protein
MDYLRHFYNKTKQQRIKVSIFVDYAKEIINKYKNPIPLGDLVILLKAKLESENIMFIASWCAPNFEHGVKLSICCDLPKDIHEQIEWPKS